MAQVTADVISRSAQPGSGTRSAILDEINKGRIAEGKVPVKVNWGDVASIDKQQAAALRETARNKASADAAVTTAPKPKSADAITAERLRGEAAKVAPLPPEPTLEDRLAESDAAVKKYEASKTADELRKSRREAGRRPTVANVAPVSGSGRFPVIL